MRSAVAGALDGAAATVVMSGLMLGLQRAGWLGELPPRRITRFALRRSPAGARSRGTESALGTLAHLAFGAGAGALFEGAARRAGRAPGPLAGAAYGTAVWLLSYAGWVPALGILPPPHRDRPGRPLGMLAAHLVFGAVLGTLAGRRAPAARRRALALLPGRRVGRFLEVAP